MDRRLSHSSSISNDDQTTMPSSWRNPLSNTLPSRHIFMWTRIMHRHLRASYEPQELQIPQGLSIKGVVITKWKEFLHYNSYAPAQQPRSKIAQNVVGKIQRFGVCSHQCCKTKQINLKKIQKSKSCTTNSSVWHSTHASPFSLSALNFKCPFP